MAVKPYNQEYIKNNLRSLDSNCAYFYFEEITSTNDHAKTLVKAGLDNNTLILAASQTHGRGTHGRNFHSPQTGIYITYIHNATLANSKTNILSFIVANSVHKALTKLRFKTQLKWINDIVYRDNNNIYKLGGILTERISSHPDKLIIGLGLNMDINQGEVSEDMHVKASGLLNISDTSYKIEHLREGIILETLKHLLLEIEKSEAEILTYYSNFCLTLNNKISITYPSGQVKYATAKNIQIDGSLICETSEGKIITLDSNSARTRIIFD